MAVTLWRVDVYYPVTRVHASTVHSAQRREEAVQKALQHVPYALLEEHEYPIVQDVRVDWVLPPEFVACEGSISKMAPEDAVAVGRMFTEITSASH